MIGAALIQRTKHLFVPGALVLAIAVTFSDSVQDTGWTRHEISYLLVVLTAILFGAATAVSRFRSRTVLAYHLLLSLIVAAESVGRFFPLRMLTQLEPQISIIQSMHTQIINLLDRLQFWGLAIINRQQIFDNGWLLFCIVLLIWNGFAWFMWSLIRRKRALEGLVPLGLMLGANIQLGEEPTSPLVTFTALSCLFIAYMVYYRAHADWRQRKVDYPDLGYDWSAIAALLTASITVFVFIFPIFTTVEGWRKIADFLERLQIEPISDNAPLPEGPFPSLGREAVSAYTPDMSTIGIPLEKGTDTIMRVRLSDPVPPPPELNIQMTAIPRHYWRNEVFGEYTGTGWNPVETLSTIEDIPDVVPEAPPGRYFLRQSFWIIADHGQKLFAVNDPVWGDRNIQLLSIGPEDSLISGRTDRYGIASFAVDVSAHDLASAPVTYPDEITDTYLQLPNTISQRTRNLAANIAFGSESSYEVVKRVEDYLRNNYIYNQDIPQVPEGRDAVDYFLFDAPGGFCSYYASAMAVILRVQGIPARVVTGYSMGEFDYRVSEYRVRVDNAHAWVEVYFSGYGWIEFEPTSTLATFDRGLSENENEEELAGEEEETSILLPRELVLTSLRLILTILGIGGGLLLYRRSDFSRRSPREKIEALYKNVRRSLKSLGYSASKSTTPNEFLDRFKSAFSEHENVESALTESTALYLIARFSEMEISEESASRIRASWRQARRQRWGLWLNHLYHKRIPGFFRRIFREKSPST